MTAGSLPVDVLGEIFNQCTRSEQIARSERASKCEACGPLSSGQTLLQVCRQWRVAALSTPSMWRYIHVDLKTCYSATAIRPFRPMPRTVEWAIERSGTCSLELSFSNVGSDDAIELVKSLVGPENSTGRRIERLEIGLSSAAFIYHLSVLETADISNLKELVLYHTGCFTVHETIPTDALAKVANIEGLQALMLGRIQWFSPGFHLFNISTLSIDLGHKSEALLLRSLACFPNLSDLILQCTDHCKVAESWEPIPEVTLPFLRRITFDPRICTYTLHKLRAPALTSITAKNFVRVSARFLNSLPQPTRYSTLRLECFNPDLERTLVWSTGGRSYKSLECMKAEWTEMFASGVTGFLECLRNHAEITNFELVNCTIGDEYLVPLAKDASLLPNLALLRLVNCSKVSHSLLDDIASFRQSLHTNDFMTEHTTQ